MLKAYRNKIYVLINLQKSAREIRQEAAQARLAAAHHEDTQIEEVTLSALA